MAKELAKFRVLADNWEAFGRSDPLFGVLSDPTREGGRWGSEEFFDSGRAHVRKLLGILHGLDVTFARGACLDFGCGVGRLTIPLSESFERTVGVDVARSMVAAARGFLRPGDRCEFRVNRDPDLRQFPDATFDFVHSCLVLQHVPPDITPRYIAEFFRVARPGGLIVFQLPAATISESEISAEYALPASGYAALIDILDGPRQVAPSEAATVRVAVTNKGDAVWQHDIPAGRHITMANHWLSPTGDVAVADDGRARLPATMAPGSRAEIDLIVCAPETAGEYVLEIDLVQERICWFAERGSSTARAPVTVAGAPVPKSEAASEKPRRPPLLRRVANWFRRGRPSFEMHTIPRETVEHTIAASGGTLLHAIDDNAAGERWRSFTYVARKAK
jgi:SAM-dependent methyltransferase